MTYLDKLKAESDANIAYEKAEKLKKELIKRINELYTENTEFIYKLEQFIKSQN